MKGLAFFDFDGTLSQGNVTHQYCWYADRAAKPRPSPLTWLRWWLADRKSREHFNHLFYSSYAGWTCKWLETEAENLLTQYIVPHLWPDAHDLIHRHAAGYRPVLISGSLDFALRPVARHLGIAPEDLAANRLAFDAAGRATGQVVPPVLAGEQKVAVMRDFARKYSVSLEDDCRAYADDTSDLPMLKAVKEAFPTHPKRALQRAAKREGWQEPRA